MGLGLVFFQVTRNGCISSQHRRIYKEQGTNARCYISSLLQFIRIIICMTKKIKHKNNGAQTEALRIVTWPMMKNYNNKKHATHHQHFTSIETSVARPPALTNKSQDYISSAIITVLHCHSWDSCKTKDKFWGHISYRATSLRTLVSCPQT